MEYKKILYEVRDGVAVITINSPKTLNAINDEIIEELYQAITAAEADDGVRVMVLTGAGKAFCAGGELGSFREGLENGTLDMAANMRNSSRLRWPSRPPESRSIAAVRGAAAGAGCSLALCCDFCFAADNAKFIEAFVGVGLLPDTRRALRPVQGGGRRPGRPDVHDGRARECGKGPGVRHCLPGGA